MGLEHAFRLMILVVLQLESEFLRADWTTPSQVSSLEPLLGTLLGSLWCPPNHISLSFPIWGSCAWFMNLRIHIFSMKMSWFFVVFRSVRGLIMVALDFWLVGLEKKEVTAGWSFPSFLSHQLQLYVTWFIPWWTRVIFLIWLDKLWLDGRGLQLFQLLLGFGWPAHMFSICWDLCVGWLDLAGLCRQACLGLVNLTKWVVFPWVMHMGFHKSYKRDKRDISWGMNNYIFPWVGDLASVKNNIWVL